MTAARELRVALAERLAKRGALRSPGWRAAFEGVPRHVFVPRFESGEGDDRRVVEGAVPAQRNDWLVRVYSDEALVIHFDELRPTTPASSSTMPTLMAVMLEALGVEDRHSVLEVGTGSGYNAALLCERLGSESVTTIDIDPGLVKEARERLIEADYRPNVAVCDGWGGFPPDAPYDRLIATAGVHRLPRGWIEQVRPGGVIVAPLSRGIVRVEVGRHGLAAGRFLPVPAGFIRMQGGATPALPPLDDLLLLSNEGGAVGSMDAPADLLEDDAFWFFARLTLAPFELRFGAGSVLDRVVDLADGSWARTDAHRGVVTQGGRRRLWTAILAEHHVWTELGRPERERFGLTAASDGRQWVWLDDPTSPNRWELLPA